VKQYDKRYFDRWYRGKGFGSAARLERKVHFAVAAAEYLGARRGGSGALEEVGKPSEVALQALEHLADGSLPTHDESAAAMSSAAVDPAAEDGGRSIWRDLPPTPAFETPVDPEQYEEGPGDGR